MKQVHEAPFCDDGGERTVATPYRVSFSIIPESTGLSTPDLLRNKISVVAFARTTRVK
jgi:hypothetical protein